MDNLETEGSGSSSTDKKDELQLQHRQSVHKFNPQLAEVVGLLRERTQLFGKCSAELQRLRPATKILHDGILPITMKELEAEQVAEGRVLHLTVVDVPHQFEFETTDSRVYQHVSVALLVEDMDGKVERCFVYNYLLPMLIWSDGANLEELVKISKGDPRAVNMGKNLGLGFKLSVFDPQLKMGSDGKPVLVVNDPANLIVVKGENPAGICRFCYQPNAKKTCARCHLACYCSQECQSKDWKASGSHKLICYTYERAGAKELKEREEVVRRPDWMVYDLEAYCIQGTSRMERLAGEDKNELELPDEEEDEQLRRDYGFAKCPTKKDEKKLLTLYRLMIWVQRVDLVKLHQACLANALEPFIHECFQTFGGVSLEGEHKPNIMRAVNEYSSKVTCYKNWFLANSSIVRRDE